MLCKNIFDRPSNKRDIVAPFYRTDINGHLLPDIDEYDNDWDEDARSAIHIDGIEGGDKAVNKYIDKIVDRINGLKVIDDKVIEQHPWKTQEDHVPNKHIGGRCQSFKEEDDENRDIRASFKHSECVEFEVRIQKIAKIL